MKKCNLFCCGWWPFLLLPLLLLLLAIFFYWRSIEADVANNANQALTENDLTWVTVDTHSKGRNVILQGTAVSESAKELAIETARSAKGVRKVIWQGTVEAPKATIEPESPPQSVTPAEESTLQKASITIEKSADTLTISGTSANIVQPVKDIFVNAIDYQKSKAHKPLAELNQLMELAKTLPAGSMLSVSDQTLTLSGTVNALGKKKSIVLEAKEIFAGAINDQLLVKLEDLDKASLVSKEQCQEMFDELSNDETVNFKTAEAIILPNSYALLDRFTQLSQRCPDANFLVTGHTDNTGNPVFNRSISLERAQAVINHIVNSGVDSERFQAQGLGQIQPIADNSTQEGRAKNRRVEFKITN